MTFDDSLHPRQVLGARHARDQDPSEQRLGLVVIERSVEVRQVRELVERLVGEASVSRIPLLERVRAGPRGAHERDERQEAEPCRPAVRPHD